MKSYQESSINYRPDIDGLRALAVIAVLIFHFFPAQLNGGFAGVDIFFVISGYLVTNIIYLNTCKNNFSFINFYLRRIRRLFPSLIIILIFTLLVGWILLLADEFLSLGKHVLAGSTFTSNFLLYSESGYFDKRSELKPLLHLWSLCIEEQFYIIWPLIIWFFYKYKKNYLKIALIAIFLISLILNLLLTSGHPSFSFYFIPTRLWELASGGLLVFINKNYFKKSEFTLKFFPNIKIDFSILGAILIFLSFFILNKDKFPGYWAILPVLGTLLIIISDSNSTFNKFLSKKWIVYIGLISYPLYLWHWPILSFANITDARELQPEFKLLLFIISFFLAIITYEYIEKPIRKINIKFHSVSIIFLSLILVGILGFLIMKNNGIPSRYPELEIAVRTKEEFRADKDPKQSKDCIENTVKTEMCAISNKNKKPTVVLIGDSHANHLYPGLKNIFDSKGENLLLLGKSGTAPFLNVLSMKDAFISSLDDEFNYIQHNDSIHTVIFSAFWGAYYEEDGLAVGDIYNYKKVIKDILNPSEKKQSTIFMQAFSRTIDNMLKLNKKVVVFYDIPVLPFRLSKCYPRPFLKKISNCEFNEILSLNSQERSRKSISMILQNKKNILLLDPVPIICENATCSVIKNNIITYSDEFHLSSEGAILILNKISGL